uniref:APC family permease n=2 Tax=Rhizobium sp. CB3060 TaxID=3138255 RepID=UPI003133965A
MSNEHVKLDRRLGTTSAAMFGLSYMSPLVVIATFGAIAVKTGGAVATAYVVATVAMLATAVSYGFMAARTPVAGSAYTYTSKVFGPVSGFIVGWLLLLDYFFIPMVICLLTATSLSTLDPSIPFPVWVVAVTVLSTIINILGIKLTDTVNLVIMVIQLVMVAMLGYLCVIAILHAPDGGILSAKPFTNGETNWSMIMAGAAVACYSFLGFDAISTLSEETVNPRQSIPRAIMIATLLGGAIFMVSTYLMMVAHPSLTFESIDTAAYEIVGQVGGPAFKTVFTIVVAVAFFAAGLCAHASASRLLLVMGRDNVIPSSPFAYVNPRLKTPIANIVLVSLVMLAAMKFDISTSTAFINFGAFTAFFAVNACVVRYLMKNAEERNGRVILIIISTAGALFCASLFYSLDKLAIELGFSWLLIGVVYLLAKTRVFRRPLPTISTEA